MGFVFGSPVSPRTAPYLFVDGDALRQEYLSFIRRYFRTDAPPMHLDNLAAQHTKTFFYDALPVRTDNQSAEDFQCTLSAREAELGSISKVFSAHVRTGETRARAGRRGARLEQKGVDVLLAVDAMSMAMRGAFRELVLITGDIDFRPLIDELVMMGASVDLRHPARVNDSLGEAADMARPLSLTELHTLAGQGFVAANPLPQAQGGNVPFQPQPTEIVAEWIDPNHGRTLLGHTDGAWQLETMFIDHGSRTFLYGGAKSTILAWALDQWGIVAPDVA